MTVKSSLTKNTVNCKLTDLFNRLKKEAIYEIEHRLPSAHETCINTIHVLKGFHITSDDTYLKTVKNKISSARGIIENSGNPLENPDTIKKPRAESLTAIEKSLLKIHKIHKNANMPSDETNKIQQELVKLNPKLTAISTELANVENAAFGHKQWHKFVTLLKEIAQRLGFINNMDVQYRGPIRHGFWKKSESIQTFIKRPAFVDSQPTKEQKGEAVQSNVLLIIRDAKRKTYQVGFRDAEGKYQQIHLKHPELEEHFNRHPTDKFLRKEKAITELLDYTKSHTPTGILRKPR